MASDVHLSRISIFDYGSGVWTLNLGHCFKTNPLMTMGDPPPPLHFNGRGSFYFLVFSFVIPSLFFSVVARKMFDEMRTHFLAPTPNSTSFITTNNLTFSLQNGNFHGFDGSYLFHGNGNPQISSLHLQQQQNGGNEAKGAQSVVPIGLLQEGGGERSSQCVAVPWSGEEVLALLKTISSMDNPWFPPEFTWENVSRRMAEFGFQRSPKKCKDKFEEETRSFANNSNKSDVTSQNYRLFGELEELYNNNNTNTNDNGGDYDQERNHHPNQLGDDPENDGNGDEVVQEEAEKIGQEEKSGNEDENAGVEEDVDEQQSVDDSEKTDEENTKKIVRKRKRQKKFEMFKGLCEKIVNKMMAQQEELHCKILEDMVKRDEERFARENAWRKHEIDKITQELQVRAHEQAIVGSRQAKILGFLDKFSSSSTSNNVMKSQSIGETFGNVVTKVPFTHNSLSNSSSNLSHDSISATTHDQDSSNPNLLAQKKCNLPISSSKETNLAPQSPNRLESPKLGLPMSSSSLHQASNSKSSNLLRSSQSDFFRLASISPHQSSLSDHTSTEATGRVMDIKSLENNNDTGRRWPRDEVLALINIRCSLFNNNGDHQDKENLSKGPLWERISQKMIELGYKRSAKRCKEKWENINKYFRKTKDLNKKRSIDSRTCPYFHQLSHLYNQGPLLVQSDCPAANLVRSPDNQSVPSSDAQCGFSTINATITTATTTTVVLGSQGNEGSVVQDSTGFGFEF